MKFGSERGPGALAAVEIVHIHLVTDVLLTTLHTTEQPSNAPTKSLHEVPEIEGITDSLQAEEAARRSRMNVLQVGIALGLVWNGVECWLSIRAIGSVGEGPKMHDGEARHLNT